MGFGFGPIQSGLFLLEAKRSGNFDRFFVAEVDAALVDAIRANDGCFTVNIAHPYGVEQETVEGVTVLNPTVASERDQLIQVIAETNEASTALPSVDFFSRGDASVASLFAEGLVLRANSDEAPLMIYCAENNNHAAAILRDRVLSHTDRKTISQAQFLETVIGKMSGVITQSQVIDRLDLKTLTPTLDRAVLVEAFNQILVSQPDISEGFERGIEVFVEKQNLMPFEEAKLYGHNAIHAMLGYLAYARGLRVMADLSNHSDLLHLGRQAFIEESGEALVQKYVKLGDSLFTPTGMRAYAEDLLERMVNPYLEDQVERVIRDPHRKLGYSDRLFGAMRLALSQGIEPRCLAAGAAAGVVYLNEDKQPESKAQVAELLYGIWQDASDDAHDATLIDLVWDAMASRELARGK